MLNQTVGNYRIVSLLGEGGMGTVYLAQHPGIGRKAAIKVLHPDLARSPDLVTRFFNEARAANTIRHPGIVEVYDFGTLPDGATYITMEFLEGESLSARLKRAGRLPPATAAQFAHQTASALAAAHAAGIVHRDLKPDNIFVVPGQDEEGREQIKILDFGIAKLSTEHPGGSGVKTRTGTVMGTPVYMSPEQCRGTKEVDHRTDIYALGIILYEMLCGQPPFVSSGYGELIHMHIGTPPAPPRTHNPGIPAELEAVVLKLLAKDAGQRYQSMGELQQALKASGAGTMSYPRVDVAPPAPRSEPSVQTTFSTAASMIDGPTPKGRRWGGPALVIGLLAAGAIASIARMTPRQKPPPAEPSAAVGTPPSPRAPAPPASIAVRITSTPSGARLVRESDGANLGVTPFKETWPKATGTEKMRLELDGFRPEPFAIPLERGVELTFPLTKLVEAAPKPKPHALAPHGGPSPKPKRAGKSEPVPL
ncbi:MAG TPA: serine/threonine-protein kinase [Polyangia bacterium]|jgi:serine/threonine-protein kinase|nr:serine/threonine-protein kinase [Polyangia bacterium]